jgi:hypothetical protein
MRCIDGVLHQYDVSASTKAHYDELLRVVDRRRLVNELGRPGQGLHHRALAGLGDVVSALIGKIPRRLKARTLACSDC